MTHAKFVFIGALLAATSAHAAEKSWMVEGFEALEVAGPHNVTVVSGQGQRVVATGDQDAIDNLDVSVSGRTLKIRPRNSRIWDGRTESLEISVSVPRLESAKASGSGDLMIDRLEGGSVNLRLAGSGDAMVGHVEADNAVFTIAGSGDMGLRGTCRTGDLSVAGSGDMDASGLACRELKASIAGSGNIRAQASGTADARVAGSGDMMIAGGAKCSKRVAGSGSIECS